jgi:hypothetical protein
MLVNPPKRTIGKCANVPSIRGLILKIGFLVEDAIIGDPEAIIGTVVVEGRGLEQYLLQLDIIV